MDDIKGKKLYFVKNLKDRKLHTLQTVEWLRENYCTCPDVCLPREILYGHYMEFCRKRNAQPVCKATFGKLVRNTFPEVTSKRLGARGQSKYHYSGIGIKPCITANVVTDGVTRFSGSSCKYDDAGSKVFSLAVKVGTLLPAFPEAEDLNLPSTLDQEKLKIFLIMYKMHCQCIVDVAISGNFEEIRQFLIHFWQGFPEHLLPIFEHHVTRDLLLVCDSIFYRTLMDVLIPTEIMDVPEMLLRGIQNIASHWQRWVLCSIENMPCQLKWLKMDHAKRFANSLKRHVALLHLSQVVRPVLNECALQSLSEEILSLEPEIFRRTLYIKNQLEGFNQANDVKSEIAENLNKLMQKDFTIETFVDRLDDIVMEVIQKNDGSDFRVQQSILLWVYSLGRISHGLTENGSKHFITFHLLSSFIQEYFMLAFENRRLQEEENKLFSHFSNHFKSKARFSSTCIKQASSCYLVDNKKNLFKVVDKIKRHCTKTQLSNDAKSVCNSTIAPNNFPSVTHIPDSSRFRISHQKSFVWDECRDYYVSSSIVGRENSECEQWSKLHAMCTHRNNCPLAGMQFLPLETEEMFEIQGSSLVNCLSSYSQNICQQRHLNTEFQLYDIEY